MKKPMFVCSLARGFNTSMLGRLSTSIASSTVECLTTRSASFSALARKNFVASTVVGWNLLTMRRIGVSLRPISNAIC